MTTRFKLIAAALGLVVAAGAIGDASAATVTKSVTRTAHGTTIHARTTRFVAHRPYRVHFGQRIVKHIRIVHRAPARVVVGRPVAAPAVAVARVWTPVVVARTITRKIVRVAKRPLLQRHAMLHRAGAKTIIVR